MRSFFSFIAGLFSILLILVAGFYFMDEMQNILESGFEKNQLEWMGLLMIIALLAAAGFVSGFITAAIHKGPFSRSFTPILFFGILIMIAGFLFGNTGSMQLEVYVAPAVAFIVTILLTIFARWGWSVQKRKQ